MHADFPVPYSPDSPIIAYDPTNLPIRPIGPLAGTVVPPLPQQSQMSVTREQAAANPGALGFLPFTDAEVLLEDPQDSDLVVRINRFPKILFHSLLITKAWRPQRLTLATLHAQLRWAREGAVLAFHQLEKFIDHFHLHLYAMETAPIFRFADRFFAQDTLGPVAIGGLDYPIPNIALASVNDAALAEATFLMAEWLDRQGLWYIEEALAASNEGQVMTLFVLFKALPTKGIQFDPVGILKLPILALRDQEITKVIRQTVFDVSSLVPLRLVFSDLWRAYWSARDTESSHTSKSTENKEQDLRAAA